VNKNLPLQKLLNGFNPKDSEEEVGRKLYNDVRSAICSVGEEFLECITNNFNFSNAIRGCVKSRTELEKEIQRLTKVKNQDLEKPDQAIHKLKENRAIRKALKEFDDQNGVKVNTRSLIVSFEAEKKEIQEKNQIEFIFDGVRKV
jgi:hypothetical protein